MEWATNLGDCVWRKQVETENEASSGVRQGLHRKRYETLAHRTVNGKSIDALQGSAVEFEIMWALKIFCDVYFSPINEHAQLPLICTLLQPEPRLSRLERVITIVFTTLGTFNHVRVDLTWIPLQCTYSVYVTFFLDNFVYIYSFSYKRSKLTCSCGLAVCTFNWMGAFEWKFKDRTCEVRLGLCK